MMRNGVLLAEDAPNTLLQSLELGSLEAVFLNLCRNEGETEKSQSSLDRVETKSSKESPAR